MGTRKAISKRVRFEIFKRDSFTCQYCGESAPDVILHVDHIQPVAEGGGNETINLITSCMDCNAGKGARTLDDHSVVKKQIDQMKAMNERKEQLVLMAKWRSEMVNLDEQKIQVIADAMNKEMADAKRIVSDSYRKEIKKMVKKYTLEEIWDAVDTSSNQYLKDVHSEADREKFLDYVPRILYWQKLEKDNPVEKEIGRLVSIARRRWWRFKHWQLRNDIKTYLNGGFTLEDCETVILQTTGISDFIKDMNAQCGDDNG